MNAWDDLERELDNWSREGRQATLWWRDDDAIDITPPLNDLLAISVAQSTPIALAVIPRNITPALREYTFSPLVRLAQHGYAHVNHAGPETKKSEFGADREQHLSVEDVKQGFDVLMTLDNAIHLFVPPWNRMDMSLLPALREIGLKAVSTFTARDKPEPVAGIRQVNTHADIMDWRGTRGFAGDDLVIGQVVKHLEDRRSGKADPEEPTGLLSHHLVHDGACWQFLETFTDRIGNHPAARWLPIEEAIAA